MGCGIAVGLVVLVGYLVIRGACKLAGEADERADEILRRLREQQR